VDITWIAPSGNGAALSGFTIFIREADGDFSSTGACVAASGGITTCSVPMSTLIATPYFLSEGDLVAALVQATNANGDGDASEANLTGALVQVVPGTMSDSQLGASSSISQIEVTWSDLLDTGGSPITSYFLEEETSLGSGVWTPLQGDVGSESTLKTYTVTGLTSGNQIFVRVTAYNLYGAGTPSSTVTLTASDVPDAPGAPVITLSNTFCRITWVEPTDNAEPVTQYRIGIRRIDLSTFTEEIAYCDGSDSAIALQKYCEIPMTVLTASPYSLPPGTLVVARVEAFNVLGYSAIGAENSSGISVSTSPDQMAPALMNNITSSFNSLVMEWSALGTSAAGYADATSYNLYWDSGSTGSSFTSLLGEVTNSLLTAFTVSTGVSVGADYQFKVRAKNVHGFGDFSTIETVTASSVPGTPVAPTTSYDANGDIKVTFSAPSSNGETITAYLVWFAN